MTHNQNLHKVRIFERNEENEFNHLLSDHELNKNDQINDGVMFNNNCGLPQCIPCHNIVCTYINSTSPLGDTILSEYTHMHIEAKNIHYVMHKILSVLVMKRVINSLRLIAFLLVILVCSLQRPT